MNRLIIIWTLIFLNLCSQSSKSGNEKHIAILKEIAFEIENFKTVHITDKNEMHENIDCSGFSFNSSEQQADSLLAFYKKATDSSLTNRIKWEQKFFCAFPNSFKGMRSLFGYDDEHGAAPLYSTENETYSYTDRHIMSDLIGFFSELKSIPDSAYYDKYIRINIDGYWEADNISEAFGFHYRLLTDTEKACKNLEKYTDEEIRSVFLFIFDGPHPKNEHNQEIFQTLKPKIEKQNERLGNLFQEAYAIMIAEETDQRH